MAAGLQSCVALVPRKSELACTEFALTVSQMEDPETRRRPERMLTMVVDAGYSDYLKSQYANYRARLQDLEQLTGFARQFESTEEFLAQLALLTNIEAEEDRPAGRDTEQLRLSTIHQAKGLEFQVVFVIMLCDGLFPSSRSLNSAETERGRTPVVPLRGRDAGQERIVFELSFNPDDRPRGWGGDAVQFQVFTRDTHRADG